MDLAVAGRATTSPTPSTTRRPSAWSAPSSRTSSTASSRRSLRAIAASLLAEPGVESVKVRVGKQPPIAGAIDRCSVIIERSGGGLRMSAVIVDGKAVAAELREPSSPTEVGAMARAGNPPPSLAVVLCGDDPASAIYVRNKGRAAERAGVALHAAPAVRQTAPQPSSSTLVRSLDADEIDRRDPGAAAAPAADRRRGGDRVHLAGEGRRRLPSVQLRAPRGGASRGGRPGHAARMHGAAAAERDGDARAAAPWSSGGAPSSGARSR